MSIKGYLMPCNNVSLAKEEPRTKTCDLKKPLKNSLNQHQHSSLQMLFSCEASPEDAERESRREKGGGGGGALKENQNTFNSALVFHRKSGYGQLGTRCHVKANYFLAKISKRDPCRYNVSSISHLLCINIIDPSLVSQLKFIGEVI
ncbi:hypothetical protein RJ641_026963 [Dillenia turbinata]|uniref:Uncharacterized protein n=1 Tax=Dillenia turbinata TaxID=194707 RepID=A0AAN8W4L5_9MAGN